MATYKRGSRWYYDFMIRGQRHRAAVPEARTKQQADRAESEAREAIYQRRYGIAGETITFAQFYAEVFLPWSRTHRRGHHTEEIRLKPALEYFGKFALADITAFTVEKWKRERIAAPAKRGTGATPHPRSAGTVNHELASLSRIFSLAIEQGLLEKNPVRTVKRLRHDGRRERVCSIEEEQLLRTWLPAALLPIFILAINTGMRCGEITSLEWPDVDFERGTIHIRRTKTDQPRTVPMNAAVREEMERLFDVRQGDVIFRTQRGEKYLRPNVTFRECCLKLKIKDLHFHDLRHTAASRLADAGASPFVIAEILGHADLRQTKRYTHATRDALSRAVESISDYGAEKDCPKIVSIAERRKAG